MNGERLTSVDFLKPVMGVIAREQRLSSYAEQMP